jgi:DNA-binding transcriptional ArsR family regulator
MRRLVERLNAELPPVPRGLEPTPCPVPAEALADPDPPDPADLRLTLEEERRIAVEGYRKEMRRNLERVYKEVLAAGPDGSTAEEIAKSLGIERSEAERAIAELRRQGAVEVGRMVRPAGVGEPGRLRELEVIKVYPEFAILRVDGKYYAHLDPIDFHGPGWILRKGNTFLAKADLYHLNGKLWVRIHSVVREER